MRTNPRHAQTPKQNTLMAGEFPGTRASLPIDFRAQSPANDQVSEK
jgi:hypothetical protein